MLHLAEVRKPVPKDDQVLVRVRMTTVCAGDVRLRSASPFFLRAYSGLFRPSKINILGMEFAGTVESVGKRGFWRSLNALKRDGAYVRTASGVLSPTLGRAWASLVGARRVIQGMARTRTGDLATLIDLADAGKLRPVIDRTYPLEAVAEAHRLAESGRKKGAVVIIVA